jgi:hypothetical protein
LTAHERDRHVIATPIVVVGSVKWLVDVSNEMNEVFEGFESLA